MSMGLEMATRIPKYGKSSKLECEKQLQCAQFICNPYSSPAHIRRELFPQFLEQFFLITSFGSSLSAFQPSRAN
jgi:hypothetical protein